MRDPYRIPLFTGLIICLLAVWTFGVSSLSDEPENLVAAALAEPAATADYTNQAGILEAVAEQQLFALATLDGDQPRVRTFACIRADETGLYFSTFKEKDVYQQLTSHPRVELCFLDLDNMVQIRVAGTVTEIADEQLKHELLAELPWIKSSGEEALAKAAVFRLADGLATVWTPATSSAPKQFIEL
ncbi:MAG: pyridoxamine 5'-phosphate oxidase family protein [bacterium]